MIISKRYEQLSNMYGTNSYISSYNGIIYVYSSEYNNNTCRCNNRFTCTEQIMLHMNDTNIPIKG